MALIRRPIVIDLTCEETVFAHAIFGALEMVERGSRARTGPAQIWQPRRGLG